MDVAIFASVRRSAIAVDLGDGEDVQLQCNFRKELIVTQGLPPLTELSRFAGSYWAKSAASAPVTSVPTTASLLTIYNGNPDGGKSVVIDSLFMEVVAVTAAIQGWGIMVCLSKVVQSVQAQSIIPNCTVAGRNTYGGNVTIGTQAMDAVSGVVGNWMPIGSSPSPQNTLQIGTTIDFDVKGLLIIPPKHSMGMTVLAGAATASSIQVGVRWHELMMPTIQY